MGTVVDEWVIGRLNRQQRWIDHSISRIENDTNLKTRLYGVEGTTL